ncbi:type IV pilin protein [Variovorax sp. PvP013]|uniref:type IV pilin protein n=1 Tax=Variovorax sp. PvP013 TaxID=3156435 RepID=UPI003D25FA19
MPGTDHAGAGTGTRGFTLIELVVAVAIVALLATIALPAYQTSVLKARRAEARAAILDLLQQQERVMTQTGTYVAVKTPGATGTPFKTHSGDDPATAAYLLGATACDAGDGATPSLGECVRVKATPARADPAVDTLWMESSGARGCEGTARSETRTCWP